MKILSTFLREVKYFSHHLTYRNLIVNTRKTSDSLRWRRIKDAEEAMPKFRTDPVVTTLNTPEFHSIFTPELNILRSLFTKYNHELRIAGGAVRDILMGLTPKDIDFATTATPEEMKKMFTDENIRMLNTKGEKHGTITARINDTANFEVTTLRIDVVTDGRHADIEFTTDWRLDANRRDLTINSMFLDFNGNVYDYFFGYDDLKKRNVTFVGDAEIRIQEDFLRILRYFRFYGKIAVEPDKHDVNIIETIKRNVDGLERISGERIWTEWNKILDGNFGMELTLKMLNCNLTKYIGLPVNPNCEEFEIVCKRARLNSIKLHPVTMISSLLKDTREVIDLQTRLRWSVYNRELALFIVGNRAIEDSTNCINRLKYSIVSGGKQKDIREYACEVLKYQGLFQLVKELELWIPPKFPLSGHDIKSLVSHPKLIGQAVNDLKKIWIQDNCKATADDLIKQLEQMIPHLEEKYKTLLDKYNSKKKK